MRFFAFLDGLKDFLPHVDDMGADLRQISLVWVFRVERYIKDNLE